MLEEISTDLRSVPIEMGGTHVIFIGGAREPHGREGKTVAEKTHQYRNSLEVTVRGVDAFGERERRCKGKARTEWRGDQGRYEGK